ncbi:MAG: SLC13 family permease [bacterium]|nr:SLC13 family permease [bacterium]
MVRIEEHLSSNLFFDLPQARNREAVFSFVINALKKKGIVKDIDKAIIELKNREEKGSTGIGYGVALPHIFIDEVSRPIIAIARIRDGIDWEAIDGEPVKIAVFVLSGKDYRDEYLKVIAKVATVLRDKLARDKILQARSGADIIHAFIHPRMASTFYRNRQYFYFFGVVIGILLFSLFFWPRIKIPETKTAIELGYIKFNEPTWVNKQIIAFTVFFATVIGTLLFWRFRVAIAAIGLGILLFTGVMDIETTVRFMSIPTILFIISLMTIVAYLEHNGVFKFTVTWVIKRVGTNPRKLYITLLLLSVVLGGLTGEVSGIIVTVTLAITATSILGINPFPFILGLVFATNIGSALTLIGNPIGIYIAFAGRLTFGDFLRWATPLSIISALIIACFTLLIFRKQIPAKTEAKITKLNEWEGVMDRQKFRLSIIIFILIIIFIAFHGQSERILGLRETTLIVAVPLFFVGVIIFMEKEKGKTFLIEGVDWWTIIFFMFLFAKAACLEYTGVTQKLAFLLSGVSQRIQIPFLSPDVAHTAVAFTLLLWFSAIASGFVDNLPIIAAMVPIVKDLSAIGLLHSGILWWALLFGGCFGGNLTMIGSSANMVALSIYEEREGRYIRFIQWFKYGLPVIVVSILFIMVMLIVQINLFP